MKMYVFSEYLCGKNLIATDCNENQLKALLDTVISNEKNGIGGESFSKVAERMYPNNCFVEIGYSDRDGFEFIDELECTFIYNNSSIDILKVQ